MRTPSPPHSGCGSAASLQRGHQNHQPAAAAAATKKSSSSPSPPPPPSTQTKPGCGLAAATATASTPAAPKAGALQSPEEHAHVRRVEVLSAKAAHFEAAAGGILFAGVSGHGVASKDVGGGGGGGAAPLSHSTGGIGITGRTSARGSTSAYLQSVQAPIPPPPHALSTPAVAVNPKKDLPAPHVSAAANRLLLAARAQEDIVDEHLAHIHRLVLPPAVGATSSGSGGRAQQQQPQHRRPLSAPKSSHPKQPEAAAATHLLSKAAVLKAYLGLQQSTDAVVRTYCNAAMAALASAPPPPPPAAAPSRTDIPNSDNHDTNRSPQQPQDGQQEKDVLEQQRRRAYLEGTERAVGTALDALSRTGPYVLPAAAEYCRSVLPAAQAVSHALRADKMAATAALALADLGGSPQEASSSPSPAVVAASAALQNTASTSAAVLLAVQRQEAVALAALVGGDSTAALSYTGATVQGAGEGGGESVMMMPVSTPMAAPRDIDSLLVEVERTIGQWIGLVGASTLMHNNNNNNSGGGEVVAVVGKGDPSSGGSSAAFAGGGGSSSGVTVSNHRSLDGLLFSLPIAAVPPASSTGGVGAPPGPAATTTSSIKLKGNASASNSLPAGGVTFRGATTTTRGGTTASSATSLALPPPPSVAAAALLLPQQARAYLPRSTSAASPASSSSSASLSSVAVYAAEVQRARQAPLALLQAALLTMSGSSTSQQQQQQQRISGSGSGGDNPNTNTAKSTPTTAPTTAPTPTEPFHTTAAGSNEGAAAAFRCNPPTTTASLASPTGTGAQGSSSGSGSASMPLLSTLLFNSYNNLPPFITHILSSYVVITASKDKNLTKTATNTNNTSPASRPASATSTQQQSTSTRGEEDVSTQGDRGSDGSLLDSAASSPSLVAAAAVVACHALLSSLQQRAMVLTALSGTLRFQRKLVPALEAAAAAVRIESIALALATALLSAPNTPEHPLYALFHPEEGTTPNKGTINNGDVTTARGGTTPTTAPLSTPSPPAAASLTAAAATSAMGLHDGFTCWRSLLLQGGATAKTTTTNAAPVPAEWMSEVAKELLYSLLHFATQDCPRSLCAAVTTVATLHTHAGRYGPAISHARNAVSLFYEAEATNAAVEAAADAAAGVMAAMNKSDPTSSPYCGATAITITAEARVARAVAVLTAALTHRSLALPETTGTTGTASQSPQGPAASLVVSSSSRNGSTPLAVVGALAFHALALALEPTEPPAALAAYTSALELLGTVPSSSSSSSSGGTTGTSVAATHDKNGGGGLATTVGRLVEAISRSRQLYLSWLAARNERQAHLQADYAHRFQNPLLPLATGAAGSARLQRRPSGTSGGGAQLRHRHSSLRVASTANTNTGGTAGAVPSSGSGSGRRLTGSRAGAAPVEAPARAGSRRPSLPGPTRPGRPTAPSSPRALSNSGGGDNDIPIVGGNDIDAATLTAALTAAASSSTHQAGGGATSTAAGVSASVLMRLASQGSLSGRGDGGGGQSYYGLGPQLISEGGGELTSHHSGDGSDRPDSKHSQTRLQTRVVRPPQNLQHQHQPQIDEEDERGQQAAQAATIATPANTDRLGQLHRQRQHAERRALEDATASPSIDPSKPKDPVASVQFATQTTAPAPIISATVAASSVPSSGEGLRAKGNDGGAPHSRSPPPSPLALTSTFTPSAPLPIVLATPTATATTGATNATPPQNTTSATATALVGPPLVFFAREFALLVENVTPLVTVGEWLNDRDEAVDRAMLESALEAHQQALQAAADAKRQAQQQQQQQQTSSSGQLLPPRPRHHPSSYAASTGGAASSGSPLNNAATGLPAAAGMTLLTASTTASNAPLPTLPAELSIMRPIPPPSAEGYSIDGGDGAEFGSGIFSHAHTPIHAAHPTTSGAAGTGQLLTPTAAGGISSSTISRRGLRRDLQLSPEQQRQLSQQMRTTTTSPHGSKGARDGKQQSSSSQQQHQPTAPSANTTLPNASSARAGGGGGVGVIGHGMLHSAQATQAMAAAAGATAREAKSLASNVALVAEARRGDDLLMLLSNRLAAMLRIEEHYHAQYRLVTRIQCAWRCFSARRQRRRRIALRAFLVQATDRREQRAASSIRTFLWRLVLKRRDKAERQRLRIEDTRARIRAAIILQKYSRRWHAVRAATRRRKAQQWYMETVTGIQRWWKRIFALERTEKLRVARAVAEKESATAARRDAAATKIQATFRGHWARIALLVARGRFREALYKDRRRLRHWAAGLIQKVFRGHLVRRHTHEPLLHRRKVRWNYQRTAMRRQAQIVIAAAWRGYATRHLHPTTRTIATTVRRRLVENCAARCRAAAVAIQCCVRQSLARAELHRRRRFREAQHATSQHQKFAVRVIEDWY